MLTSCIFLPFTLLAWTASLALAEDIPTRRWANACVMLSGSLLCFGGKNSTGLTSDLYSLDLYKSWNTSEPAWSQLDPIGDDTSLAYFCAAPLQTTQGFLINGGEHDKEASPMQTFLYNSNRNAWGLPVARGEKQPARQQHTLTTDHNGRVWIWGGFSLDEKQPTYYNTWAMLDTMTWIYYYPIASNPPPSRIDHTATMVSHRYILILGGLVYSRNITDPSHELTLNPVSMNLLLFYDTLSSRWINTTAGGNIPAPRHGHSAVLSTDSKNIIVFGGGTPEADDSQTLLNDVFIFQLATLSWAAPSIAGVPPKPRMYHEVSLLGDQMLVLFGMGNEGRGYDDVSILSLSSWSWISEYTSNPAWLSGNMTSSNGIVKNSTGTYSDTRSNSRDPSTAPSFPAYSDNMTEGGTINDTDGDGVEDELEARVRDARRIKAGIIAGVVSGGIVVIGGGIFLVLSIFIYRQRQSRNTTTASRNVVEPRFDDNRTLSDLVLTPIQCQKPDNQTRFLHATELNELHKPNQHD